MSFMGYIGMFHGLGWGFLRFSILKYYRVWSLDGVPELHQLSLQSVNAQLNKKQMIWTKPLVNFQCYRNDYSRPVHAILGFWFGCHLEVWAFSKKGVIFYVLHPSIGLWFKTFRGTRLASPGTFVNLSISSNYYWLLIISSKLEKNPS